MPVIPKILPTTSLAEGTLFCSKIKDWNRCKRYYYNAHVLNREPLSMHTAFYVGSTFHHGAMLMYQGLSESAIVKEIIKFQKHYKSTHNIHPEVAADMRVYDATGLGMVLGYIKQYTPFVKKIKVVSTEQSFQTMLNINGQKVPFIGTVDLMYTMKHGKDERTGLWVEDHKTASSIREDTLLTMPLNLQMSMYPAIVKRTTGLDISGMVYSIVKKPDIRLKSSETVPDFVARIKNEYLTKPDEYFHQEFIEYNSGTVSRVMTDVLETARDIIRWYDSMTADELLDETNWPRNEAGCFPFGHKRENRCAYFDLCRDGNNAALHKLQYFKQRVGTPRGDIITRKDSKSKTALLGKLKGNPK